MERDKIKVLLVCHFSNANVREHLPLDDRKWYNRIRHVLGMPEKKGGYADLASWDTNLIDILSKREDVELHVISAHSGLKRSAVHFHIGNVDYCFLRCEVATGLKRVISSPAVWNFLNPMRFAVHKIAYRVQPDVIALIGAENAYISGTVLGLEKKYPVIVKAQTIYNNPERSKFGVVDLKNAYVEKMIFDKIKYFSVTTKMHNAIFRQFNKTAYNLKWRFGTTYPDVRKVAKEFDFVNFAMAMIDKKGFHDAVKALAIVRMKYPNASLNLVGGGTREEVQAVKDLISQYGLENQVTLTPLFEKQADMFQHIQKARFALLPCKMDYVSSTVRQAMHYGLPVICYSTEGTVTLNNGMDRVLIAENGDVEDLAAKMTMFMDHPEVAAVLAKAAKEDVDCKNDNVMIAEEIVSALKAVVANFKNGTLIPEALLYDKVNL